MLKLAYIVQGDKMHNYALCLLEQFALCSYTVFVSLTVWPFKLLVYLTWLNNQTDENSETVEIAQSLLKS